MVEFIHAPDKNAMNSCPVSMNPAVVTLSPEPDGISANMVRIRSILLSGMVRA